MKKIVLSLLFLVGGIGLQSASVVEQQGVKTQKVKGDPILENMPRPDQKINPSAYATLLLQYMFFNDMGLPQFRSSYMQTQIDWLKNFSVQRIYFFFKSYTYIYSESFEYNVAALQQVVSYWQTFCKLNNYLLEVAAPDEKNFKPYNPVGYAQALAKFMGASDSVIEKMSSLKEGALLDVLHSLALDSELKSTRTGYQYHSDLSKYSLYVIKEFVQYCKKAGHDIVSQAEAQKDMNGRAKQLGVKLPAVIDSEHIMDCVQAIAQKIGVTLPKTVLGKPLTLQQAFIIIFDTNIEASSLLGDCCKYVGLTLHFDQIGLKKSSFAGFWDFINSDTTSANLVRFLSKCLDVQVPRTVDVNDPVASFAFLEQIQKELGLTKKYWSQHFAFSCSIDILYKDIPVSSAQLRWTPARVYTNEKMTCPFPVYLIIKIASLNSDSSLLALLKNVKTYDSCIVYDSRGFEMTTGFAIYYQNSKVVEILASNHILSLMYLDDFFLQAVQDTPARQLCGVKFNSTMVCPIWTARNDTVITPLLYLMLMGNDSTQTMQIARILYNYNQLDISTSISGMNITPLMLISANAMNNTIADMATYAKFTPDLLNAKNSQGFTAFDIANVINNNWRSGIFKNDSPSKQAYVNTAVALQKLHA